MNDSYNIIRRFTPPTCTLEIWGKNSPLSRWTNKTIIKDVQFKLSFDDPRILETEPMTLSGDRETLDRLYDVVLSYTENFLEQSFSKQYLTVGTTNQISQERSLNENQPYLQAQGLVDHQFHLGNLIKSNVPQLENTSLISLSATQLFDLVSALEEYKTEMAVLAQLEAQQKQKTSPWIPIGLSVAGIILAAGLTTMGIKLANQSQKEEQIATTQETPSKTIPENTVKDVVPPDVPKSADKPALSSQKNDPLSSTVKLPPPPAVDTLKPPPDIPDPAKYPPSGTLKLPPIAALPRLNSPSETNKSTQETPAQPNNDQVESTIAIPPETAKPVTKPKNPEEATPTDANTQNRTLQTNSELGKQTEITTIKGNIAVEESNKPLEPSEVREALSKGETETNVTLNDDIAFNPAKNQPQSKIPQAKQLEEVADYFRQKWRSPQELKQTLEYRLIINQNGSLKRVIPIGKAAEIYLDRTNIPLMGESFVSALEERQSLTIRLLLSPDGEVRTFLE